MDFGLSEDQLMLDETLRSFLKDRAPIARVRELRDEPCPNDREIWKQLAEFGATGILAPAAQGGSALSLLDAALWKTWKNRPTRIDSSNWVIVETSAPLIADRRKPASRPSMVIEKPGPISTSLL